MVACVLFLRTLSFPAFGDSPIDFVPSEFLTRAGVCLVVLAAIASASRHMTRLPHVFSAVAQETLLIYFIHLCIVYGSVWNRGLMQYVGESLRPAQTLPIVVAMVTAMVLLAWGWNRLKHSRPKLARWAVWAVTAAAVLALLA